MSVIEHERAGMGLFAGVKFGKRMMISYYSDMLMKSDL